MGPADVLKGLLGATAVVGGVGAFLYWLVQKSIDARFARGLEDYRHMHSATLHGERVRLDLYDRRFEVFESIFPFYEAMISWTGSEEQLEARKRFHRAWHKSSFLFSKESGVPALLESLNNQGMKVIGFKEHKDELKTDPQSFNEEFQNIMDIQTRVFSSGLTELKEAMSPYLDFTKV